jgi:lactate dehydrogenase-like 2-hydroxyacid dehydrogenase
MAQKPVLVVTRKMPDAVEARIREHYTPRFNTADCLYTPDELIAAADGADAMFVTSRDRIDAAFVARVPASVKAIATFSVGVDHIDFVATTARNLAIFNTPGVLTDATADLTLLLLLGASRRAGEGEALMRSDNWTDPRPTELLGWQLTGQTLGIFGMGRIGQAVAHRARAFGMNVHYTNRRRLPADLEQGAVFHADYRDLFRASPFLTLHAPATPETLHLLNAETIEMLPPGAVVVNAARGGLVRDEDLIAALRTGRLAAAGIDVFDGEPRIHPGYRSLPNTFLLPHLGSATVETRTRMGMIALDNLDAFFAGRTPPNLVTAK